MSSPSPPSHSSKILPDAVVEEIIQNTTVVMNVAQSTIIVTEDKVRLCLIQHVRRLNARDSWLAPVGILATIITTLVTTAFKDLGLSAATWKAVYVIAAILVGIWAVRAVIGAVRTPTVEDIVEELKRAGTTQLVATSAPDMERRMTTPVAVSFPTPVTTVLQCDNCGASLPATTHGIAACARCGKSYGGN